MIDDAALLEASRLAEAPVVILPDEPTNVVSLNEFRVARKPRDPRPEPDWLMGAGIDGLL